ncbi:MAG: response regulator [Dysgonamonadaceae bacterium]|jgi:signal transduction histidine kinase/ligand-binding sensor domain-containing protein/DNA-binding NarL/FixJ family response regulator|nr:response regulator [Dysgonamonadaceae bacterium]
MIKYLSKRKRLLVICLFCFSPFLNAQNWHPVQVLSTNNGLPTDDVKQVYQDTEGYIWMATRDGLCRYDGYQIKTYKSNLYTPNLLSSNKLNVIAEDGNNRIWIGANNGLNVLDKTTGAIKQVLLGKLRNNNIQALLPTEQNGVWIGTENGLYQYIEEQDSFICHTAVNTNNSFHGYNIKTLCRDYRGNIWIGTWSEGLYRWDKNTGVFYACPQINPQNSAHVIFEDDRHTMWIGTWGYGLVRLENPYDPEKVRYIRYMYDKNHPGSLYDNTVYALSQDLNTGSIWVGTKTGLSILNDRNDMHSFTNYLPNQSGLLHNEVNSIIRDNTGLMWLGLLGGGVSVINTSETLFHANPLDAVKTRKFTNNVRSMYVDKKGIVWMGIGSAGLVSYDPSKNQYTFFEAHPDFKQEPIFSSIYHITQIGNAYWFATYGQGVFTYNPDAPSPKLKNISYPQLNSSRVFYIREDSNRVIWIGTMEGVNLYNPDTDEITSYRHLGLPDDGKEYAVYDIVQIDRQTMWIATSESGIFRLKIDDITSKIWETKRYSTANNKLNNDNILRIFSDSKGTIWIGSEGGGLSYYDEQKDAFVCVQQAYNLPGDIVYNIAEDRLHRLWLVTNAGLVLLNNEKTWQFTITNGLLDNYFNRNAFFQTSIGELYVGGHKGYNYFYPDKLQPAAFVSPVVITDIKIYNKSMEMMDAKLQKKISANAPGYTKKIRLPHNYNNFSIEFAALNYQNPMQSKYVYQLYGYDKDRQLTDVSRRYATYNNLKSGVYTFRLKAMNESGVWSESEPLQVEILPPFWLAWWAYLIYFAIIATITYFSLRMMKNKLLMQNAIRVKDIEKQKIEELNHAKLQFFTNITHEFLTPLTIISASVDELKNSSSQHNDLYDVISNNIARLIRLLQQILEFRKAETGNLKLKVSKGDIALFVKNSVENFNPLMKKKKIHFSIVCDPDSIPAYFDYDKLDKILFNLLSNAAKYNQSGGFVQVNLAYLPDKRDAICISVKDNGEGIHPKEINNLFKRFYEGDYRRFNTIGTGIGLSLTKDLVRLHKGEITVESEVDKGTVFHVKIPIAAGFYDENETDDCSCVSPNPTALETIDYPDSQPEKKEHTLLLVEDNEELLQVMVKLLSREYNIFTAKNGREGIEVLEEEYIDLTISDVMMPEMDGIEFCKFVKNKFEISHVPIILLTAKDKEEDRIDAYDSGADGFITKPFNLNVLYSKIKNLLKAKERVAKEFKKQFVYEAKSLNYTSVDEAFLNKAVLCVNQHIADPDFDQQQFADALGVSKSTLYKKLKSLTDLNTSAFIRNIRLKTACKLIEENRKIRISELSYTVGFNDPKYFSVCFKKEFGLTPSEYLEKILAETGEANESK